MRDAKFLNFQLKPQGIACNPVWHCIGFSNKMYRINRSVAVNAKMEMWRCGSCITRITHSTNKLSGRLP